MKSVQFIVEITWSEANALPKAKHIGLDAISKLNKLTDRMHHNFTSEGYDKVGFTISVEDPTVPNSIVKFYNGKYYLMKKGNSLGGHAIEMATHMTDVDSTLVKVIKMVFGYDTLDIAVVEGFLMELEEGV